MPVITVGEERREYEAGTTFLQVAADFQDRYENDILLVKEDGKLVELFKEVHRDADLEFITAADTPGQQVYERSAILLLLKGIYGVAGQEKIEKVVVNFSVTRGCYIEVKGDISLDETFIRDVKAFMEKVVKEMMEQMKK